MKKIFFVLILCIISSTLVFSQQKFTVKGKIEGYASGKVYLKKYTDNKVILIDSTNSKNGEFTLSNQIDLPEIWIIQFGADDKKAIPVFLSKGTIGVTTNYEKLNETTVTGSVAHTEYTDFQAKYQKEIESAYKQFFDAKKKNDQAGMNKAQEDYQIAMKVKENSTKEYVRNNPKSVVAAFLAASELMFELSFENLKTMIDSFDKSLDNSIYINQLQNRYKTLLSLEVGQVAPDFSLNDTTGKAISLSSFRGKYVLIDFWASWCAPCRADMPSVVELYKDYKNKGFEILGVSFDQNRISWKKSIHDLNITWTQISDLKGWQCAAGQLYAVTGIPHTVLLDKNGVILAKNLRGEELRTRIAELLGKP